MDAYGSIVVSFLLGVSSSLVASAGLLLLEAKRGTDIASKKMLAAWAVGVAFVCAVVSAAVGLDAHYVVPSLDQVAMDEADTRARDSHFIPIAEPTHSDLQLGRVIPGSQSVAAGQLAPAGTELHFKVADAGTSSLDYPRPNATVD